MKLLLDTHALLWWLSDLPGLNRAQRAALAKAESAGEPLYLAAISLWELAKAAELGRVELLPTPGEWLAAVEGHTRIRVLPLSARIASESCALGAGFHKDPADQIIVATARVHELTLVTVDDRIRKAGVAPIL